VRSPTCYGGSSTCVRTCAPGCSPTTGSPTLLKWTGPRCSPPTAASSVPVPAGRHLAGGPTPGPADPGPLNAVHIRVGGATAQASPSRSPEAGLDLARSRTAARPARCPCSRVGCHDQVAVADHPVCPRAAPSRCTGRRPSQSLTRPCSPICSAPPGFSYCPGRPRTVAQPSRLRNDSPPATHSSCAETLPGTQFRHHRRRGVQRHPTTRRFTCDTIDVG